MVSKNRKKKTTRKPIKTLRKSKKKTKSNSAYFEYKSIFGSKVDVKYDQLIQSKKKKGYVEGFDYFDNGDKKPKPPTKIQREYVKVCRKAEKNSKLNPGSRNFDCEGMLDREDKTLQLMTDWYKDAMKNGEFNWSKYEKHLKRK